MSCNHSCFGSLRNILWRFCNRFLNHTLNDFRYIRMLSLLLKACHKVNFLSNYLWFVDASEFELSSSQGYTQKRKPMTHRTEITLYQAVERFWNALLVFYHLINSGTCQFAFLIYRNLKVMVFPAAFLFKPFMFVLCKTQFF